MLPLSAPVTVFVLQRARPLSAAGFKLELPMRSRALLRRIRIAHTLFALIPSAPPRHPAPFPHLPGRIILRG